MGEELYFVHGFYYGEERDYFRKLDQSITFQRRYSFLRNLAHQIKALMDMKRRLLYQRLQRRFHLEHGNMKEEMRNFDCGGRI